MRKGLWGYRVARWGLEVMKTSGRRCTVRVRKKPGDSLKTEYVGEAKICANVR